MRAEPDTSTSIEIGNDTEKWQIVATIASATFAAAGKTVQVDFAVKAGLLTWEHASTQKYELQPYLY